VKGRIVLSDDHSYEELCQIWNGMIQKRPVLVAQCEHADVVVAALAFAREHGLEIAVCGGGHNIAGNAVCDGGIMIDLSLMKEVQVDPEQRRAYAEAGATLEDLDRATQVHALATPVGINSTTGIAGLTLGGGFGWLTRKYGMTVDHLVSADVVTVDGRKITANEVTHSDLFWALRGGSGDFGDAYGEHVGMQPYVEWQKAFDPLLTPGARNYWKSHDLTELSEGALAGIYKHGSTLPTPQCEIFLALIAGVQNRVAPDATAYRHRDARFVLNVHARWDAPGDDDHCMGWARSFFEATAPYASGGAYVNFMTEEEGDRVRAAYGDHFERLVEIKRKYDPGNLLHLNQNIRP